MINFSARLVFQIIRIFKTKLNRLLKEKNSGAVVREEEPVSFLSESFSQYPVEVQEAINRLKSQYDLEDGDIETVVNNLWSDPPHYYEVTLLQSWTLT